MSIFSFFLLLINFINIVTRLSIDFYRSNDFYHYDDRIDVVDDGFVKVVSNGAVWGGVVGMVGRNE